MVLLLSRLCGIDATGEVGGQNLNNNLSVRVPPQRDEMNVQSDKRARKSRTQKENSR